MHTQSLTLETDSSCDDWSDGYDPHAQVKVSVLNPTYCGFSGRLTWTSPRTWTSDDNLEELKTSDPGLAIAASVPVHRLGLPQEVANVAIMWVASC